MLRVSFTALMAATFLAAAHAAPQPAPVAAQTFTISGTVVGHGSNRPLKDSVVTVAPVEQAETSLSYRTGEDGRFTFTQLKAGKYSLAAKKRGFPPQTFQQNEDYSTAIAVGPGLDSANIVFPLSAGGLIMGTVVDEEGDPVRQAEVMLFSNGVFSGAPQVVMRERRGTDSSGQFRFPNLNPGTYFVAVQAHPWYAQNNPIPPPGTEQTVARSELDVVYPLTYYAGAIDPASASAITVTEGQTSNLQMTLRPVPALHVQISGLQSKPGEGLGMMVSQMALGGFEVPSNWSGSVSEAGNAFELSGIAPGRYILSPQASGPRHSQLTPTGVFDLAADEHLDVSAFRETSFTGQITFEGNGPQPPHPALVLVQPGGRVRSFISVDSDGSLRLNNGSPLHGRYELRLQNAPGFYLKSVKLNGATVSAAQLDIPESGSVQLSVAAARGLTSINGIAVKDDKPLPGAMVLLIPKDLARTDFIRRDQSDSDGTFTLPEVPPGRYMIVAIDDGTDLLYRDPSVMKPYLHDAQDVSVPLQGASPIKISAAARRTQGN